MTRRARAQSTDIDQYNAAARASSATVIDAYSTSFGLATRLLSPTVRSQVRTVYALVRIADEIVDGAATGAGLDVAAQREQLDDLERETERAIHGGYSTNLVVHAFATTARLVGIDFRLTAPFFASMRRDLDPSPFTEEGVAAYIYGSAEVIGLMCLRCFIQETSVTTTERALLEDGARRLGAAFQKVNFLRDLACDRDTLGRNYFPGLDVATMTDVEKDRILDDIDADLAAAEHVLPMLPGGSRRAVTLAHHLFSRLSSRLRGTPAQQLLRARVRVPDAEKLVIAVAATLGAGTWKR
ncbi:phytoene/squalene synthase family protein [Cryobacterium tagatosivorans]|uniref:phytoene/squalene synthase family protein n=1 Tax=Cryobacterium tagatosivorans TaxID=1259199 RepID=UPI00141B584D|nr:squalene/phytoene synthase family protein [Cryobacterium tagatosivorans]